MEAEALQYIPEPDVFPPSEDGLPVSEEEYWEEYYEMSDRNYEWNNGILEEKPVADHLSFLMYKWFLSLLEEYFRNNPIGEIVGLEIGFRLPLSGNTSIRKPDMAVVLNSNPVPIDPYDRSYGGIFDMCFEFLSDSTKKAVQRDTVIKKSEYCRSNVEEYFILDRKGKETAFYRLVGRFYTEIRPLPGGVIRSGVLPGFQFRLNDLYRRPDFTELTDDPVYKSYVLKKYQAQRLAAEEAEQRAEKADKLAEEERMRAEKADKLAEKERMRAEKADKLAEEERMRAEKADKLAEEERMRAEKADKLAEEERMRAEKERVRAEKERVRAEKERVRAEKLAARLRELGIDDV
ncbi:Uma2 family endonuclease [Desulfococcaceae bacterium HSG8]|nr:Uma2 family endonuclease [Desulfococcaceae bacterium HSG8]